MQTDGYGWGYVSLNCLLSAIFYCLAFLGKGRDLAWMLSSIWATWKKSIFEGFGKKLASPIESPLLNKVLVYLPVKGFFIAGIMKLVEGFAFKPCI